jgi:hypothetical protein
MVITTLRTGLVLAEGPGGRNAGVGVGQNSQTRVFGSGPVRSGPAGPRAGQR